MSNFLENLEKKISLARIDGLNATYCFRLTDVDQIYCLRIVDGQVSLSQVDEPPAGERVLILSAPLELWEKIVKKEITPQLAFMSGKLKTEGDMSLALKLPSLLG